METTGQRIRALRQKHVVGQAELARLAGITHGALWEIESGKRDPRPLTIRKLAEAFSSVSGETVKPSDLVGAPNHPRPGIDEPSGERTSGEGS